MIIVLKSGTTKDEIAKLMDALGKFNVQFNCIIGQSTMVLGLVGDTSSLDVSSAIPVLKKLSHLPVVIDPSHAAGINWMVEPLSMAAIAAGADGLIIEVHNNPKNALCDGAQSLTYNSFAETMVKLKIIANAIGRKI